MDSYARIRRKTHLIATALTYLFLYLPILVLFAFSFNSERFPAPWRSFTLQWYYELFHSMYLWKAFSNSLIIAFFATLISLLAGVGLIFYAAQGGRIGNYLSLFYGNLIIPETVFAVSLLTFLTAIHIPLGIPTLILAHSILGFGLIVPITYTRFLDLDKNITEASLDLGATPLQTFLKVTLPLLRPSLITTSVLVFILSFDDFILSYFCSGSTAQTLSLYILSMMRTGISPVISALSSILLILSSLLFLITLSIKTKVRIF